MGLASLVVEDLRCLRDVRIEPASGVNLISGPNASGKTSLLEAIFFLGRGRTFRAPRRQAAIREGADRLRVVGRLAGKEVIGVEVTPEDFHARARGQAVASLADLATLLPVQLVDPEIHRLVQEGPGERRRYLDWATFHVKHGFLPAWRDYQRALRQRNAALRSGLSGASIGAWDDRLVETGEAIDRMREEVVTLLAKPVADAGRRFLDAEITLRYRPGHAADQGLLEALHAGLDRDRRAGLTQVGPHRADLVVGIGEHRARGWVSRGQQKLVAAALVLGQAAVLAPLWQGRGVLLVDDPAAELDAGRFGALLGYIRDLPFQVFMTALGAEALDVARPDRVFHVEQGNVHAVV